MTHVPGALPTRRGAKPRHGVIFDLTGAQSPSYRGRGIARYSIEMVRSVAHRFPELITAIALHAELPIPDGLDDLGPWLTTEPDFSAAAVLHMTSVFEPELPVSTFWPRQASAARLLTAVTVYDLIPDIFPGWYLVDPGLRRRWRACREVVRAADAVFTLSESARQDVIALLGAPEWRVSVIGSGTSPSFCPPASRAEALKLARRGARGLRKGFVLYAGAFNPRKNVDRLLQGYASMPKEVIDRHQLVIVGEAPPLTRNHYLVMAKDLGLEGRVLIPGHVPEEVFVALHQAAELAVYPSHYEGYGLPVVDALACGTPAIGGDNSSLQELLPREARFQPDDPWAIGEAITRALTDPSHRRHLLSLAQQEPPSWASVAERAATTFERLFRQASEWRPGWHRRPVLATVAVPPELGRALGPLADCDHFLGPFEVDEGPGGLRGQLAWPALSRLDRWRGGYDAIVGWAANLNEQEMRALEQLGDQWPGRAIAVVAGGLVAEGAAELPKLESRGLKVVPEGSGWDETAQLVLEASRAPAA